MERAKEQVRIDEGGVARPLDRAAIQRLRYYRGTLRIVPSPSGYLLLAQDDGQSAPLRLAGEIVSAGSICDVIALIANASHRGELLVMDGDVSRSIFFDGGNIVGALSTAPAERLGELMYKVGLVTREQVLAVSKKVTSERRFGECALDMGLLGRERLYDLVRQQTEEIFFALLRVERGSFWFVDGYDDNRIGHRHHVSAHALLMEGVRRMDETKYFRERIPSDAHVPVRTPNRLPPPDHLTDVWSACNGQRSVLDVGRICALSEFEVTHALFQLVQAGFVKIAPPSANTPEAVVELFNGVMRPIMATAHRIGHAEGLRRNLGAFASSVGVYDAIFGSAPPGEDGALVPGRISMTVASVGGEDPTVALRQWLYDYAAYALFDLTADLSKADAKALHGEVDAYLAKLAPKGASSMHPGPKSVRPQVVVAKAAPLPKATQMAIAAPPPETATPVRAEPSWNPPPPSAPAAPPALMPPIPPQFPPHSIGQNLPLATPPPLPAVRLSHDEPVAVPISRRPRRVMRGVLLAIAIVLLLGSAGAGVWLLRDGGETASAPKEKNKPKAKAKPKPSEDDEPPASSATASAVPSVVPSSIPSASASASSAPSASIAPPPSATASSAVGTIPEGMGRLVGPASAPGHRVFVDGKVMGQTPDPILVKCGTRNIRVGSAGAMQTIDVPCGGEVVLVYK